MKVVRIVVTLAAASALGASAAGCGAGTPTARVASSPPPETMPKVATSPAPGATIA
jgi:hypothetical protein